MCVALIRIALACGCADAYSSCTAGLYNLAINPALTRSEKNHEKSTCTFHTCRVGSADRNGELVNRSRCKWIGKRGRWKRIVEQIHVDTQTYVAHPSCTDLLFVIVDAVRDVPDPRKLESELTGSQTIDEKEINIRTIVCET